MSDDFFSSSSWEPAIPNGPTTRGTFVGTCTGCGVTWEFENHEVIPVPYPHGTCPKCRQWVAVF